MVAHATRDTLDLHLHDVTPALQSEERPFIDTHEPGGTTTRPDNAYDRWLLAPSRCPTARGRL